MSRPDRTYVESRLAEIRVKRSLRKPGRRVLDGAHIAAAAVRARFAARKRVITRVWAGR